MLTPGAGDGVDPTQRDEPRLLTGHDAAVCVLLVVGEGPVTAHLCIGCSRGKG
jgi:hypothetical protein